MSDAVALRAGPHAWQRPAPSRGPIVHVSADVPDLVNSAKPSVVETLVRLVDDRFDQRVVSINRVAPSVAGLAAAALRHPMRPNLVVERCRAEAEHLTLRYRAPPSGLFHRAMLEQLGDWLANELARGPRPALLVGHKLSVEGIAVARAAQLLDVPYALSLQGNTDVRIVAVRPDLRPLFRRVYHGARFTFAFAPWTQLRLDRLLGARVGAGAVLPCPTTQDRLLAPRVTGGPIVSAFHFHNHRGKNARRLIAAMRRVRTDCPNARLTIFGGGTAAQTAVVAGLARDVAGVELGGAVAQAELPALFNAAAGFALPSLRESFGLVFVEALFAGAPILYPADTAVDGYFDELPFAVRVDAHDPDAIAEGLRRLLRDEAALKRALASWQASPAPARFQRAGIAQVFGDGLAQALATP